MKIIEKDLLTVESGIIAHQVNCQGVMGSGVAKLVKDKWPKVYEEYLLVIKAFTSTGRSALGRSDLTFVGDRDHDLYVANIYGQNLFGSSVKLANIHEELEELDSDDLLDRAYELAALASSGSGSTCYTDYAAVGRAVQVLGEIIECSQPAPTLYVPYLMGCDRGGGDWDAYSVILDLAWPGEVVACRLPS